MLKYIILSVVSLVTLSLSAGQIKYNLKMPKPQNHYYHVEMELNGFKEKELNVKMPVWTPGSYLVREFAKSVNQVHAYADGKELSVKKTDKNTWTIAKGKAKNVTVKYEVYAFEVSVRTAFLDLTHGFVSGTGVFMYLDGHKYDNGTVEIFPHSSFKTITTALEEATGEGVSGDGSKTYQFTDYDELVDCPIEIGNQEVFTFNASGVEHTVAMYGVGNYNIPTLQKDMANIVNAATDVFGQNPNKKYTFIIHNVVDGQGGLEHKNSTVLSVNRWTYDVAHYKGFLSLVAHEYFHLWNVKRIRPRALGPFDYDQENYTSLLWVMEGFTSYYDELLLRRAGYYTKEEFLGKLFGSINYVEGSNGARVQPVAHASFDAWIKAYRPTENSSNVTISYYSKGAAIASVLDAMIINKYDGTKCLDHFMQHIYKTYFVEKGRGFTEDEFKVELESFLQMKLDDFYAQYINGTSIIDYNSAFEPLGLKVENVGEALPSVGVYLGGSESQVIIRRVRSGSAAEEAGLSVGDEIVGCNGFRVDKSSLNHYFDSAQDGDVLNVLFSRDEILYSTDIVVTDFEKPEFKYTILNESTLFNYWLR